MDSPLRWFRRHSKIMMVVIGTFAMAIFGLGNVLDSFMRPGARIQRNDSLKVTLASWNGGKITREDLNNLQLNHFQTIRFLEELQKRAFEIKKDEYRALVPAIQPLDEGNGASQIQLDEQLINRFILAKKAEKEGIIVSDGVIDEYLEMLSGGAGFSKNDLTQINQKANPRVSLENVRRHLRIELLAQQMGIYKMVGLPVVPNPTEAAELNQQVTERVECLVLPISVEDYFTKIAEQPPQAELKKLYEQGKYDYRDSTGKIPGFKLPNKVAVQFLSADFETFMQNALNKLTDEQVQAEYDRLVAEKDDLVMEIIPDEAEKPLQIDTAPPTQGTEGAAPTNGSAATGTVEPSADAPKTDAPNDNSPSLDTPKAETPSIDPPKSDTPAEGDQSMVVRDSKIQHVSYGVKQDEPKPENVIPPTQDPAATVPATDEPAPESAVEDKPATQETTPESAGGDNPSAVSDAPVESQSTPPSAAATKEPGQENQIGSLFADDKKIEKRVLPLKDVAEKIKRKMVQSDVEAAMEEAAKNVTAEMSVYYNLRMNWELSDESKRGSEPEPVNIKTLADNYNMIANETELVDYAQLVELPFGAIDLPILGMGQNGQQQFRFVPLARNIFDRFDDLKTFDPQTTADMRSGGSKYVFWLKAKQDATVPKFEECQVELEKFWKSKRAIELAKAEAKKIADTVNGQQKTLKELYGERVSATGEFSWFSTFGNTLYGQPEGVDGAGQKFMEATFALGKMQAAAAVNESQSIVYVVQMLSERQSIATAGTEFVEKKYLPAKRIPADISSLSQVYFSQINLDWNQELVDEMGLKIYGR